MAMENGTEEIVDGLQVKVCPYCGREKSPELVALGWGEERVYFCQNPHCQKENGAEKETECCSRCNSPLIASGQRGFGSLPQKKCTNPLCAANKPGNGWCK